MAIYIDPPMWPAHGTLWSHLVSDTSYDELHEFATRMPLPRRGFDLDHYDVPASRYHQAIAFGAIPVGVRDVVNLLRGSGLRVRTIDRVAARPIRRREYLLTEWTRLADAIGISDSAGAQTHWQHLGNELMNRWNEPHRQYHNERHLEDVLLSLNHLTVFGERISPVTLLAAWFHDAIYQGVSGVDEQDSAEFAMAALAAFDLEGSVVQQVGELIQATAPATTHERIIPELAHLLDADLAIFAASDTRYQQYTAAVRVEYAHVPDEVFREGRANILNSYLVQPTIYRTGAGQQLWEQRARANLMREISTLHSAGAARV